LERRKKKDQEELVAINHPLTPSVMMVLLSKVLV
jgi:hypothetical protein